MILRDRSKQKWNSETPKRLDSTRNSSGNNKISSILEWRRRWRFKESNDRCKHFCVLLHELLSCLFLFPKKNLNLNHHTHRVKRKYSFRFRKKKQNRWFGLYCWWLIRQFKYCTAGLYLTSSSYVMLKHHQPHNSIIFTRISSLFSNLLQILCGKMVIKSVKRWCVCFFSGRKRG